MIESHEFQALWERYEARVLSFIQAKVSSQEDAEDLFQEVFLRVHTGLCCLQEWDRMERWIFRVTRNLIIDHYRARRPNEEFTDTVGSPPLEESSIDDPVTELAFSLREMVEKLPEPYREALLLTEYEGLSQVELASRLGLGLPAAKSRVQRAREKLKELLLECCHFELDRLGGIIHYESRCSKCDLVRASRTRR